MSKYIPIKSDTLDERMAKARLCGQELDPEDDRASWIDSTLGVEQQFLIVAYHEGQAERYELESW